VQLLSTDDPLAGVSPQDSPDPFTLFRRWYATAESTEISDPNAMALATAGSDGAPNVRMVLLKSVDENGFVFYTNAQSKKGGELSANMHAAGVFHWKSLGWQVRFRGPVEFVSNSEADAYFVSRSRGSRVGAWASRQSRPLTDRDTLLQDVERADARFRDIEVPRPPQWNGYRVRPVSIEFWVGKPYRLHDRLVFTRERPDGAWKAGLLYP
jgi:pyridoxamine 5'-phosphate oxidase